MRKAIVPQVNYWIICMNKKREALYRCLHIAKPKLSMEISESILYRTSIVIKLASQNTRTSVVQPSAIKL